MTSSVDDEIEHDVQVRRFLAAGCGYHFIKGKHHVLPTSVLNKWKHVDSKPTN